MKNVNAVEKIETPDSAIENPLNLYFKKIAKSAAKATAPISSGKLLIQGTVRFKHIWIRNEIKNAHNASFRASIFLDTIAINLPIFNL